MGKFQTKKKRVINIINTIYIIFGDVKIYFSISSSKKSRHIQDIKQSNTSTNVLLTKFFPKQKLFT